MSLTESQLQFAAEFIALVVSSSLLALIILRPDLQPTSVRSGRRRLRLTRTRSGLAALALSATGGAAFVHGSLLINGSDVRWIGAGRAAAAALLALAFPYLGALGVSRGRLGGALMQAGFMAWLAAGAVEAGSGPAYATDGLLVAGSVLIAVAMLRVARRSIAVRVAAGGAVALLLVVIVLALALSAVISSRLQSEELGRLSSGASADNSALTHGLSTSNASRQLEAFLSASFPASATNPLFDFVSADVAVRTPATEAIRAKLDALQKGSSPAILAYADPTGDRVIVPGQSLPVVSNGFDGQPDLRPSSCEVGRQGLFEAAGQLYEVADTPVCATVGGVKLGVAIVADPVDNAYVAQLGTDPAVAIALVSGRNVFANLGVSRSLAEYEDGSFPSAPAQSVARSVGGRYAAIATLPVTSGAGAQRVDLLLSESSRAVLSTRDQLFRTLFLIAFGGTILALGLAIFTGDRITVGLRRLTKASADVTAGDVSVRAGVRGEDEVATLGSAFDAMVDSVTAQSVALQHAAEDEARLRNRLQAIVAGMNDALVAVDFYGRITEFNRAAVTLTGVPVERALGARFDKIIRLLDDEGQPIEGRRLRVGSRGLVLTGRVGGAAGETPVAVSSGVLRGPSGEIAGTVLVLRDMRREQEVEQMKTEFLSRIGHELRTPLTGILGYADILLRRPVPEDRARVWHDEILQSARRLLRIVEMLEFFASEGAGRVVLRPEAVDVRAVVNGIASAWSERLPPNLTLGRRLPSGEALVTADPRWLSLAVDELIDNAVKFSPDGGRIVIRVTPAPESVEVSVADQGMGMTAQHYDELFGEFVQGDQSDTRRFGGLGLGLAVVRRVVEGHGGTIACRSTPGRGTTVTINLPACPDGTTHRETSPAAGSGRRRGSPTAEGERS